MHHDAYHIMLHHPQLHAMPEHHRNVVTHHLQQASYAAARGDHTTAGQHLHDAARRAGALDRGGSARPGSLIHHIQAQQHVHDTAARTAMGLRPQSHAEHMTGRNY
jgi:hypothetical protein